MSRKPVDSIIYCKHPSVSIAWTVNMHSKLALDSRRVKKQMDTENSWWTRRISFPVYSETTWTMPVRVQWLPLPCLRSLWLTLSAQSFIPVAHPCQNPCFSHRFDGVQTISIGHDLCLESLVLLQFGLQIAWILPAIILGNAILLINPGSHLWGGKNRSKKNLSCFFSSSLPGSPLICIKRGTSEWGPKWIFLLRFCFPKLFLSFMKSPLYLCLPALLPGKGAVPIRQAPRSENIHGHMCAWGSTDNDPLISNPLSVSHKKELIYLFLCFCLMVAVFTFNSLLMHLFFLHFAVIQCTVELSLTRLY